MDLIKEKIYKKLNPLNKNTNNKDKNTFNTEMKTESKRKDSEDYKEKRKYQNTE